MKNPDDLDGLHHQSDQRAAKSERQAATDSANKRIPSSWSERISSWFDGLAWRLTATDFQEELEIDRRRQQRITKQKKQD